ncbi:Putative proline/betaine transporter [Seminavis robusta]|uniref:Proline/betaine transporter n=1 Tax=Seminavis robusta TaxID=568900 RepID=A0A9N8H1T9_9STRA|nr:Putative proline/betaine transporter [Seminavis robusta]|eukprot:Sro48_g028430.1 Putative proline/betaine transporter (464) ;mRNA; r:144107-145582
MSTSTVVDEPWHSTVAGVMGNVLEWYDFALFGYFSDVIAQVFFPPSDNDDDDHANLVKSFCIFGGAFLMRPVGGLLIGYVGDKHGRKEALTKSLFMMAIPTTLMGCLPTYKTAGGWSIFLLVVCRLVQGVSVGGQLPASLVYTVEKRDPQQWGYYGSLPMVAANVGTLLGNLCGAFMRQVLSEEQLLSWGWRLPFFSGILIAAVALYLKATGADVHTTAGVYDSEDSAIKNPIRVALAKENRWALLSTALTPMLWASGFYVSFVWMAIFMDELNEPPVPGAFWINAVSMLLGMTFMLPIAGSMSDRVGRVPIMTCAGVGLAALGPVLLILISKGNPFLAFLSQFTLGVLLSFFGGPLCAWLVENFSPEVRLTSASLGYDLAHALVGGFSPAIATALYVNVGKYAPGLIYVVFGVISVFGLYVQHFCGDGIHWETRNKKAAEEAATEMPPQVGPDLTDNLPEIA